MNGRRRGRQGHRSIRLRDHDYSRAGAPFVTICTADRDSPFGEVVQGAMVESPYAQVVRRCWNALPAHYPHVALDAFVIMPDHVHGILVLRSASSDADEANRAEMGAEPATRTPTRHGLQEVVRALKTYSARDINGSRGTPGTPVWQRGYWEHAVRDWRALDRTRRYIAANP